MAGEILIGVTLVLQIAILAAVLASVWFAHRARMNTKATTDLILRYRGEIDWLTARVDALEDRAARLAS